MKKSLFILLLLPYYCLAQIPAYYSTIDFTQTGDNLKAQLAALITSTHLYDLDYTPEVWDALEQTDLDPENTGNVLLVYGYEDGTDALYSNDRSRDVSLSCHTNSCNTLWVREHTYPRSLGNPNLEYAGPGSDAHHIRAIDNQMNGSRSNRPYADGSGHATTLPNDSFYPGDEWKGDIARMMMYMYVRYQERCEAIVVGVGSTSYSNFGDMPDVFLEWNSEDPVSQYEMNRNNILQNMQGNRNPFIDNPSLATIIWNGPAAADTWGILSVTDKHVSGFVVYPTVTSDYVYVKNPENVNYSYKIYNELGQEVSTVKTDDKINLAGTPKGIYYLNIAGDSATETFKILLK